MDTKIYKFSRKQHVIFMIRNFFKVRIRRKRIDRSKKKTQEAIKIIFIETECMWNVSFREIKSGRKYVTPLYKICTFWELTDHKDFKKSSFQSNDFLVASKLSPLGFTDFTIRPLQKS